MYVYAYAQWFFFLVIRRLHLHIFELYNGIWTEYLSVGRVKHCLNAKVTYIEVHTYYNKYVTLVYGLLKWFG